MKPLNKKDKIERAMANLSQFEQEKMLQAWNIVKIFVSDVDAKRPWIYWEDVKKVIEKIYKDYDLSDDQHAILQTFMQHLEQKVWMP